ncbi:MAG: Holliday junction branch migration protein RuvA [Oligoflexia bacterium]|nr:Holliday junction branch migration protein RuvA [Oligoflexia bacterium]
MIASLRGRVQEISGTTVTLDVQGVGYELICSLGALERLETGKDAHMVVFTDVKQDSIRLYGFSDKLEKQVFLLLTRVKGVGARSASEILSAVDKRELLRLIAAGNVLGLQAVKRIGKKTAERIVVELKDKVAEFALGNQLERMGVERVTSGAMQDAIDALEALGFSRTEAEIAVGQVAGQHLEAGEIVREALRYV